MVAAFAKAPRLTTASAPFGLESGATSLLDYGYQGPQQLVLVNPDDPSGVGGLTQGEVFFYSGRSAIASGEASLYARLPKVDRGPAGLALFYQRSGSAALSMSWQYEISSDLVNWSVYGPVFEEVIHDGEKNLSDVFVQLPAQSPIFVRIQLDYHE